MVMNVMMLSMYIFICYMFEHNVNFYCYKQYRKDYVNKMYSYRQDEFITTNDNDNKGLQWITDRKKKELKHVLD